MLYFPFPMQISRSSCKAGPADSTGLEVSHRTWQWKQGTR